MKRSRSKTGKRPLFSARQIAERLLAQKAARRAEQKRQKAVAARRHFKPRKSDRGKIVFVGTTGKRNPAKKGRKGYPIYVTRTGKKWLIKQSGEHPFKARTISELVLPTRNNLRNATSSFQRARLVRVGRIHTISRGIGQVKTGGASDFSQDISNRIAQSIRRTLQAQASHRVFLIKFNALVKLPDGTTEAISGEVPIERPDHIAIRLAGIRNFVRQKFYAFMARELAHAGYVSNGSANHIRRLTVNQGKDRRFWRDKRGEAWSGRDKEQVEIIRIEWKIEQST